jgi:hypothetical protein
MEISTIIYKYNPLNFHKTNYIMYDDIIRDIKNIDNLSLDKLKDIFINNFGEDNIIFNTRNNHIVFQSIYNDIKLHR